MILALASSAFADTARLGSFASGLQGVVGIGDVSSGIAAEVNSVGGVATTGKAVAYEDTLNASTGLSEDTLVYTGACYLQGIYVTGESAGDWAAVYDAVSKTGNPVFDPRIAANTSSVYFDTKGVKFSTGIYIDVLDNQTLASVVYDY